MAVSSKRLKNMTEKFFSLKKEAVVEMWPFNSGESTVTSNVTLFGLVTRLMSSVFPKTNYVKL